MRAVSSCDRDGQDRFLVSRVRAIGEGVLTGAKAGQHVPFTMSHGVASLGAALAAGWLSSRRLTSIPRHGRWVRHRLRARLCHRYWWGFLRIAISHLRV